jgi:hypothetical protein
MHQYRNSLSVQRRTAALSRAVFSTCGDDNEWRKIYCFIILTEETLVVLEWTIQRDKAVRARNEIMFQKVAKDCLGTVGTVDAIRGSQTIRSGVESSARD